MNRRDFVAGLAGAGWLSLAGCTADESFEPDVDVGLSDGSGGTTEPAGNTTASPPGPPRETVVPPVEAGPFPVGATNIELEPREDLGEYQQGFRDGDDRGYVDQVLANPEDAFAFDLDVPDDPGLYGSEADSTIPIVGFVLYPTADHNDRADYTLGPATVPRMQGPGQAPLLPDSDGRFPLLVYSHGRGATPLGPGSVDHAAFYASHGYVVCVLFHGDRRFEQLDASSMDQPQEFTLRPLAVSRVVDELLAGNGGFDAHLDAGMVGGVGVSYGGTTMAALTGAELLPFGMLSPATDRRFRATVGIVSYMDSPFFGLENEGAGSVFAPHMTVAGSADALTDLDTYAEVISAIPVDRYLVVLSGQGHEFEPAAWPDAETWAHYFLEAHVRGDRAALGALGAMAAVEGGVEDYVAVP